MGAGWPRRSCARFGGVLTGRRESALRAAQSIVVAQRMSAVLGAEQAAALQDRHHLGDEVLQPAGQVGRHHVESVGGAGLEPLLQIVGDLLGGAGEGAVSTSAAEFGDQLADGEGLLLGGARKVR